MKRDETLEEKIARYEDALRFYADPDTYAAVAFRGDPPCGDFVRDLTWSDEYMRDMPGSRARQALGVESPEEHEVEQIAKVLADAAGEEDLWDNVRNRYVNMARESKSFLEASAMRSARKSLAERMQTRMAKLEARINENIDTYGQLNEHELNVLQEWVDYLKEE